jgi:4-alpha-glucanotransferase
VQVSGVPPDAFSDTGQLWGSPLYRWPAHDAENYAWWSQRIGRAGQARS